MESLDNNIEHWIGELENDKVFDRITAKMEEQCPGLLAYFYLPQFEDLKEDEGSYLLFLGALLYAAYTNGGEDAISDVSLDRIQELEDKNWKFWEQVQGKSFDDKVSHFPDEFWDPGTELIVTMIEHDPEMDINWPPAVQEILFVSLLSFYEAMKSARSAE